MHSFALIMVSKGHSSRVIEEIGWQMFDDLGYAIVEGSRLVKVGTVLFGAPLQTQNLAV